MGDPETRLAAVMHADVVGYSRLIECDKKAAARLLANMRTQLGAVIEANDGRVVDFSGDNLLAEFASAAAAVETSIEIIAATQRVNADAPPALQMEFRIGLHLGDVVEYEGRIHGDGVNIAARLQSMAPKGGVCISGVVYEQVKVSKELNFRDRGPQSLKNISSSVHAYDLVWETTDTDESMNLWRGRIYRAGRYLAGKQNWDVSTTLTLLANLLLLYVLAAIVRANPLTSEDPAAYLSACLLAGVCLRIGAGAWRKARERVRRNEATQLRNATAAQAVDAITDVYMGRVGEHESVATLLEARRKLLEAVRMYAAEAAAGSLNDISAHLLAVDGSDLFVVARAGAESRPLNTRYRRRSLACEAALAQRQTIAFGSIRDMRKDLDREVPYSGILAIPVLNVGGSDPPLGVVSVASTRPYHFNGLEKQLSVGLSPYIAALRVLFLLEKDINRTEG